jgi:hypothetical protein
VVVIVGDARAAVHDERNGNEGVDLAKALKVELRLGFV